MELLSTLSVWAFVDTITRLYSRHLSLSCSIILSSLLFLLVKRITPTPELPTYTKRYVSSVRSTFFNVRISVHNTLLSTSIDLDTYPFPYRTSIVLWIYFCFKISRNLRHDLLTGTFFVIPRIFLKIRPLIVLYPVWYSLTGANWRKLDFLLKYKVGLFFITCKNSFIVVQCGVLCTECT